MTRPLRSIRRGGWLRLVVCLGLLAVSPVGQAHIGSPNTLFDGEAGPYRVRVVVRAPGVVPGLAEITVRVDGAAGTAPDPSTVTQVTVRPVRWDVGLDGAPPADEAEPVRGDDGLWSAELWLMTSGSYSVYVGVEGEAGEGTAIVPVVAAATETLDMSAGMTAALLGLGGLLFAGAVTLVGAGVRESVLRPGASPEHRHRKRAWVAMAVAGVVLAVALWGGQSWWDSVDQTHLDRLYRPFAMTAQATGASAGGRTLELVIDDERFQRDRMTPIVPDHGKLMHMFLVREPGLDVFAHLHPVRQAFERFAVDVSALPAGSYRVYADLTHESGYAQTLSTTVDLPPVEVAVAGSAEVDAATDVAGSGDGSSASRGGPAPDTDDSWHVAGVGSDPVRHAFDDGHVMTWLREDRALSVSEPIDLRFRLDTAAGEGVRPEPYMGMTSHAAVRRHDGAVFIHLHPTGTISMKAQELFESGANQAAAVRMREQRQAAAATQGRTEESTEPAAHDMGEHTPMDHDGVDHAAMGHGMVTEPEVTLPYAFPEAGTYRMWVQIKAAGRVYTGVFDAEVEEGASVAG